MLKILGRHPSRFCDGHSRRHFLKIGGLHSLDEITQKAFDVLTSSRLVEALDLEREDPAVRDRYGRGSANPAFGADAGPHWMDQFLMASSSTSLTIA